MQAQRFGRARRNSIKCLSLQTNMAVCVQPGLTWQLVCQQGGLLHT